MEGLREVQPGDIAECCADPANRYTPDPAEQPPKPFSLQRCRVCERRHITLKVEPIKVGTARAES